MTAGARPRGRGGSSLVGRVEESIRRERMFPEGCRVLVMVSGGQDSLALLHILARGLPPPGRPGALHAVHVNHHLRGSESDEDETLVVAACSTLGVGLTVEHRPVDKRCGNVQEVARDARREAALAVAAYGGYERVALGHTADDQVETMLYRLGRYGGLGAFAAMAPCDPPWVRPLLGCRREETAAYCRQHGLDFANDRGNTYPGYARTAIREQLLPAWEAALPGAVGAACRAAEVAAETQALVESVLRQTMPGVVLDPSGDGPPILSAAALLALAPSLRRVLLHRWLDGAGTISAPRSSVLAVEALLGVGGSAERSLAGGLTVRKEYDRVSLEARPVGQADRIAPRPVPLPVPGSARWGDVTVTVERVERFETPDISREAYLDAGAVAGSLTVRGPLPGDRLRPLGAPGTRKLQDVFVDEHVPRRARAHRPLVVCGERIVWVCGLVVAEEYKITDETTSILRLRVSPAPDGTAR